MRAGDGLPKAEAAAALGQDVVTEIVAGPELLAGRGLSPGLLSQEPASLHLLPQCVRPGSAGA